MSSLVVGDCNYDPKTQRKKYFCSCVDAASGADVPEAAVLDCIVGSFDSCPVVVRLVQDGLLQLNTLAVLGDSVFNRVLDVFRVVSVSRVVRNDWHGPCSQQVVVPIKDQSITSDLSESVCLAKV